MAMVVAGIITAQSKADSLIKALNGKGDTSEIKTLNSLSFELCKTGKHEEGIKYSETALMLSKKVGFKKGEAGALNNLGYLFYNKANYPEALRYYLAGLKISESCGDKKMIVACYNNLGRVYEKQKDYDKALQYHYKSLHISELLNNKAGMAGSYCNIGNVYNQQEIYDQAIMYYKRSMTMAELLGKKPLVCSNLNNMGYIYLNTGDFESANTTLEKALKLSEELNNEANVLMALINLGSLYVKQGKELKESKRTPKFSAALTYFNRALDVSRKSDAKFYIKDSYKALEEVYNEMHKPEKALENFKQYILYRDSIFNEENTKKSLLTEMDYEFEKKEAIAKATQAKKEAVATAEREKERQQNKIVFTAIMAGLLFVSAFALFAVRANHQKRKANVIIEEQRRRVENQKEIVECKQKEILDSIHYAKRIQTALLTTERYIDRQLQRWQEYHN